jgi:hypothetical protein
MSNLENCPTCENPTSVNAETCPKCGEPLGADWAVPIRETRAIEIEAEELALKQRAIAQRKSARNKRMFWSILIGVPLIWYVAATTWSDYQQTHLKENNPAEFQKQVQKLEQKVAKVPTSNFDENIRLYEALSKLDPENKKYVLKIETYQKKKEVAEATTRKAKEAAKLASEKAAKAAAEKAATAAAAAKAAKEEYKKAAVQSAAAEKRRKGHHCLSGWDGANSQIKRYAERNMRDPDSFEHIGTWVTPVNQNGEHFLTMKYRAKNGFGGLTIGIVKATMKNSDCSATITSME